MFEIGQLLDNISFQNFYEFGMSLQPLPYKIFHVASHYYYYCCYYSFPLPPLPLSVYINAIACICTCTGLLQFSKHGGRVSYKRKLVCTFSVLFHCFPVLLYL